MTRFDPRRLQTAWKLLLSWTSEDRCPAIGAVVGTSQWMSEPVLFGRHRCDADSPPVRKDAIFLIASPTKPLTATAVMILVEEGALRLVDPVADYIPEFAGDGKELITVGHLLTHTSGLPDTLPENVELRAAEAPLSEFVGCCCRVKPDFPAGHGVQYQSTGFLMLGEIVARVSGMSLPEFLRRRVFEPVGMHDTTLGMPPCWEKAVEGEIARVDRIAEVRLPEGSAHAAVWNGPSWRRLGAPWGGLLATPGDWARLCRHLLRIHAGGSGVVSQATLAAMTSNRLALLPNVPEASRRCQPWGLGWQLNWPTHNTSFGGLLSDQAYGHWGSVGTMIWIDPARDVFAVLLTTQPLRQSRKFLPRFTNAVCGALRFGDSSSDDV